MTEQPEKMSQDEIEDLIEDCNGVFDEIIFDNQDIADKAFPKLYEGLTKFAEACRNSRLKKEKESKD